MNESSAGSVTQLTDLSNARCDVPNFGLVRSFRLRIASQPGDTSLRWHSAHPAMQAYRVNASIAPITPAWSNGQDINFDGQLNTQMRGYNDWANIDLRQVGATGGEFASWQACFRSALLQQRCNVTAGGS